MKLPDKNLKDGNHIHKAIVKAVGPESYIDQCGVELSMHLKDRSEHDHSIPPVLSFSQQNAKGQCGSQSVTQDAAANSGHDYFSQPDPENWPHLSKDDVLSHLGESQDEPMLDLHGIMDEVYFYFSTCSHRFCL